MTYPEGITKLYEQAAQMPMGPALATLPSPPSLYLWSPGEFPTIS